MFMFKLPLIHSNFLADVAQSLHHVDVVRPIPPQERVHIVQERARHLCQAPPWNAVSGADALRASETADSYGSS